MPTHPKGEKPASSRKLIGLVVSNAGVGLIDSKIGVTATLTKTDGITNRTKPEGSAVSKSACAITMPKVCTIIYNDSACPRFSFVAALLSQLSAVT